MIKLSIIVLSFNTKETTLLCISSIAYQYKKELEKNIFEIILVDNASADGSVESFNNFQFQISNFKLIKNKENLGFSKGCNIGVKNAGGEFIFFLNSDTQVKDNGLLKMLEFLEKNREIGILGSKLKNSDNTNQSSVGVFYNIFNVFVMLFGGEKIGLLKSSPKTIKEVDWVSGASMMIRKSLFDKINGFDEIFFMYVEDMEICFRVKKMGYKICFYPNIEIQHDHQGSSNRAFAIKHIFKGILYFYKKHYSFLEYNIVRLMLLSKAYIAILFGILTNNKYLKNTYKQAIDF